MDPSFRVDVVRRARPLCAREGEPEVAEAQYEECLERFPVEPLVVQGAANYYETLGQRERAIEILEKALEQSGNSVFRAALAARMQRAGETEEQERLLRAEAEERPSPTAWFTLANFYVGRDEFDEALEAFDHALALSPDPPESLLFAYADTLVQAEQFDKARSIVEGFEESALRDLIIGRILLGQGDPAGALVSFEAGILLWPNNPAARYLAGQAAEGIGDFDRATAEYRESIRADSGPHESRAGSGRTLHSARPIRRRARRDQTPYGGQSGRRRRHDRGGSRRPQSPPLRGRQRRSQAALRKARPTRGGGGRTREAARREQPGWCRSGREDRRGVGRGSHGSRQCGGAARAAHLPG